MRSLAPYLACGFAVALAIDLIGPRLGAGTTVEVLGQGHRAAQAASVQGVDRTLKGDRLVGGATREDSRAIVAVEIVGLRNAAVIYRDNEGREIFRTDPVTNATVVAKGVKLPEVTIRDTGASRVDPMPVNAPRAPLPENANKLPVGCESPVSPLAGSARNLIGRCISQNGGAKFARVAQATR